MGKEYILKSDCVSCSAAPVPQRLESRRQISNHLGVEVSRSNDAQAAPQQAAAAGERHIIGLRCIH